MNESEEEGPFGLENAFSLGPAEFEELVGSRGGDVGPSFSLPTGSPLSVPLGLWNGLNSNKGERFQDAASGEMFVLRQRGRFWAQRLSAQTG